MGRRDRERRERIIAGVEQARTPAPKERMRLCNVCRHLVPESQCRQHIRDCWGIKIADNDPIPEKVPMHVRIARGIARRDVDGDVVTPVSEEKHAD